MKKKEIGFQLHGKKIKIEAEVVPFWKEGIGLCFSRRERARALLFDFKKLTEMSIHSYFVFFEFLAIWLDEKNKVVDFKFVKPFEFNVLPSGKFTKLLEIPLNEKYKTLIPRRRKV